MAPEVSTVPFSALASLFSYGFMVTLPAEVLQVIKNSNGCNLAVDIWSLGCTVLEMATTKPPWSQYEGVSKIEFRDLGIRQYSDVIHFSLTAWQIFLNDLILLVLCASKVAAMFKIGNSKELPEIPDHLSEDGKNFIRLCLQRNPLHRPTAAQLLEHPFVRNVAPLERTISSAEHSKGPPAMRSQVEACHNKKISLKILKKYFGYFQTSHLLSLMATKY